MTARILWRIFLGLALLICDAAPAVTQQSETRQFVVEIVWLSNASQRLIAITGAAVVGHEIWVADPVGGRVLAFDERGRFVEIATEQGNGPGESQGPYLIAAVEGSGGVAVYDINRGSVDLFDVNGRHKERLYLSHSVMYPKDMLVESNGRIWLTGGIPGRCCSVHVFNADGELELDVVRNAHTNSIRAGLYVAGGAVHALPNGRVLFSRAARHEILLLGDSGRTIVVASEPATYPPAGDSFIRRDGKQITFDWYFPRSTGVFALEEDTILNVVTFAEAGATLWELYDFDGNRLSVYEMDMVVFPLALTNSRDIVAWTKDSETDEAMLVRLRPYVRGQAPKQGA